MRKLKFFIALIITISTPCRAWAIDTWGPIIWQTGKQAIQHSEQIKETLETIKQLERQIQEMKRLKELAEKAAEGIDNVESISDFRNLIIEIERLSKRADRIIDRNGDISKEWEDVFESLEGRIDDTDESFENIDVSDEINSIGYTIADSYQRDYQRNSQYTQELIQNSKIVNEKGALRQIAEEMAHMLEMQNHTLMLLSQLVKQQSVENSNQNLGRKVMKVQAEQENENVRKFINIVDSNTFGL